jgi:3',5'-nucleoside bisphosphate phosphatase
MNANLHLHSRFSDGSLWPEDIALEAARLGLAAAALTDHDTLGGTDRFLAECARLGMEGITACEIDVLEPGIGYKSEILAYFPGKASARCIETGNLLGKILEERKKRLEYYLYWARTIFRREDLVLEDVLRDKTAGSESLRSGELGNISWSKVDLFLYLKARRLIPSYTTYKMFKNDWFVPGRFPKYKLSKPSIADCVRAAHADGGFAVIPHIGHLWNDDIEEMRREREKFFDLLAFFRSRGVDGVEMYWYSENGKTKAINEYVRELASPLDFMFTFGSDCHGPGTDKHTLGKFSGDFGGFPV